jgi:hypothetical protein
MRLRWFLLVLAALFVLGLIIGHVRGRRCDGSCRGCERYR